MNVWRQEPVVDWGFNVALAASLVFIVAGAAGFLWLLGAMADPAEASRLATRPLTALAGQVRGQGWWWAEERRRW